MAGLGRQLSRQGHLLLLQTLEFTYVGQLMMPVALATRNSTLSSVFRGHPHAHSCTHRHEYRHITKKDEIFRNVF